MSDHKAFGLQAEEKAADYLTKQGLTVLKRNVVTPYGEMDIIAMDGEYLVFIEVKCRRSTVYGLPREAVNGRKQKRYYDAAMHYIQQQGLDQAPLRFDVIEVQGTEMRIQHLKNAF